MYVLRENGNIVAAYANKQEYAAESLADTGAELIAFLSASAMPDVAGFIGAVKAGVGGILGANALMVQYPAFFAAIQQGEWADVQALLIDARSKNIITSAQYTAIKSAATVSNIPVSLP